MIDTRRFVVFDNNAYSGIGSKRLQAIIAAEKEEGIQPLASLVVAQELLAGVRDPDDRRRGRNRNALARLREHCGDWSGQRPIIRFVSDTDSQILHLLLGPAAGSTSDLFDEFGGLIGAVVDEGLTTSLDSYAAEIDEVARHVSSKENDYVQAMDSLANAIHAGELSTDQYRELAPRLLVQRAMFREQAATYDENRVAEAVNLVKAFCAVGLALHWQTLEKVMGGKNISSDANTLWDEEITCATSAITYISGGSVFLVTEEGNLLAAAASVGAADRVMKIRDYETLLGIP